MQKPVRRQEWRARGGVGRLIVFLCTSSPVSHYCVQTRGDVYSAETSKSTAPGCNLVTSSSVPLPALLTPRAGPATPWAHWSYAAAKCLPCSRIGSLEGMGRSPSARIVRPVVARLIFPEIIHTGDVGEKKIAVPYSLPPVFSFQTLPPPTHIDKK